ncbi:tyrosine-type recombinase/integrase [Sediminitomix flava]|uniref:Site-specific recombinase XerD n=1 Tax=Sediminitomix flava TaxID=379075 RepID=A0A315Z9K1_SEDFL|nr:site-specific integrase [Sediminitomix flava]PWJ42236.1 site-specific recombinase XerD [Sediminitomix flava]
MASVSIRERKGKKGIHLALDIYDGGKRSLQSLKITLYNNPKDNEEKAYNREMRKQAKKLKNEKLVELNRFGYDRVMLFNSKSNFFNYAEEIVKTKIGSNQETWRTALQHLHKFNNNRKTLNFSQIDIPFAESYKRYLLKKLAQNSACAYYNRFRAVLNQAEKEHIIHFNPNNHVSAIPQADSQREYLTHEELQILAQTECKKPKLKQAFLFSCYTGLRWSDVTKLTWNDIKDDTIKFRPQKTKSKFMYLKLNKTAKQIIEEIREDNSYIFRLSYGNNINLILQEWVMRAGIFKHITFHCARHTFATMAITYGADIYVLKEVLGHSDIKTTSIYAKIIDSRKDQLMDCIPELFG